MPIHLTEVISQRVTTDERLKLERLKATFPQGGWRDVYQWIFDLPGVRAAIDERIEDAV